MHELAMQCEELEKNRKEGRRQTEFGDQRRKDCIRPRLLLF
jgi:hypothetical protein